MKTVKLIAEAVPFYYPTAMQAQVSVNVMLVITFMGPVGLLL
jgi:hypothetical protein